MNSPSPYIAAVNYNLKYRKGHYFPQIVKAQNPGQSQYTSSSVESYMCLLKVANQRGSALIPAQDGDESEKYGQEEPSELLSQTPQILDQPNPVNFHHGIGVNTMVTQPTFSDLSRATEMTAMVSALRHVVSGQSGGDSWGYGSSYGGGVYSASPSPPLSAYSSSSAPAFASASASWSGQKRGREEEEGVSQLIESIPRGYRGPSADFRLSQGDSTSAAIG